MVNVNKYRKENMFDTTATKETVEKTIAALSNNGITAELVTASSARERVLEMIPEGSEVMIMTSVTVDTLGISEVINGSTKYISLKKKLATMDDKMQKLEKNGIGAAPEYALGSVHAVTEDGSVFIASATGSQLPAYAYGATHVIWVVGTQKIVTNADEAMRRINEYVLPLESERAHKAYGVERSYVNKVLRVDREVTPGRITILFVDEKVGF